MSSIAIYVPGDATAVSLGADEVAAAIAAEAASRGVAVTLIRNGSRGMFWLEPLVEVVTAAGRLAYGPVGEDDVPGLFDAGFLNGGPHPLSLGVTEDIPYLKNQERLLFARCGLIDPLSADDYVAQGGTAGLAHAVRHSQEDIVQAVIDSGLRGRGGAGFPTGIKWRTVQEEASAEKYICCNADEGDSGTFADRMVMEGDPFSLIEGMAIAGMAVGAARGFIYLRSEYPHAERILTAALDIARARGWLGPDVLGSGLAFDIQLRIGAGAYICGEETAMLESLEGKRGVVRAKPPLPAHVGLFGQPTVINNVLTLASVPVILAKGPGFYRDFGMGRSRGTQPFQLSGDIRHPGIVEKAFGVTLRTLLEDFGGGTASGRAMRAVQMGGPLGAHIPSDQFDLPCDYEALMDAGAMLGHGGIVVFNDTVDMAARARFAMEFCAKESCGKCTPCRIGSTRGVEVMDRILAGTDVGANLTLLQDLCEVMADGSLCAMGGMTPYPVKSALTHFPEDFQRRRAGP